MIPNDLHYNFPGAAWPLAATPVIALLFWRLYAYRQSALQAFAPPTVLGEILVPRSSYNYWAKTAAFALAWAMAAFALMQPKGNGRYPLEAALEEGKEPVGEKKEAVVQRKAHDVIFLIDASASMGVKDTRIGLSRLEFAKEIVDEVTSKLKGENVAVYAFTSDTTQLSPPTLDYLFARLVLRQIGINEGDTAGTNLTRAISDMRDRYFSVMTPKLKTFIVLTDGGDTRLEGATMKEREQQIRAMQALLSSTEENAVRVFTIGVGTEQGKTIPGIEQEGRPVVSSLDEELLKTLSSHAKGEYYFANDWTSFDLARELAKKISERESYLEEERIQTRAASAKGARDLVYDLYFQLPLGLAILLLVFAIFFPDSNTQPH